MICSAALLFGKLICAGSLLSEVFHGRLQKVQFSNPRVRSEHSGRHSSKRMNVLCVPFYFSGITIKSWV